VLAPGVAFSRREYPLGWMKLGAKVVCLDDVFPAAIKEFYMALPVKGATYTVREVSLGREKLAIVKDGKIVPNGASDESVTVRILLHELVNPLDPFNGNRAELGFNAERFREVEEAHAEEQREEFIAIGAPAEHAG
jgi:hypothetical protein